MARFFPFKGRYREEVRNFKMTSQFKTILCSYLMIFSFTKPSTRLTNQKLLLFSFTLWKRHHHQILKNFFRPKKILTVETHLKALSEHIDEAFPKEKSPRNKVAPCILYLGGLIGLQQNVFLVSSIS